jgi:hypothetical protein
MQYSALLRKKEEETSTVIYYPLFPAAVERIDCHTRGASKEQLSGGIYIHSNA